VFLLEQGQFGPKFQVEGVIPTNHSSCRKTRINILSYGVKIWPELSFVLSQSSRLTDRQTAFLWLCHALHYMQSHSNKTKFMQQSTFCVRLYYYKE